MRAQLEEIAGPALRQGACEKVRKDIERDKILTAEEAKAYGLIDDIIPSPQETRSGRRFLTRCDAPERVPNRARSGATRRQGAH